MTTVTIGSCGTPLVVGMDATPLLGRRTGIGRYTEHLLAALSRRPEVQLWATAFTARGWRGLSSALPDNVRSRALPIPARALRMVWTHSEWPSVTTLAGRSNVFHATNFVLPPTGRAAGVVTIHDLAYLTMPDAVDATSRALIGLVPQSLRRAGAVCTPTVAIAEDLREAYGPALPDVFVTHLGVDPRWLAAPIPDAAAKRTLKLPDEYFLFVGTREPRKDLATLLAAYRLAKDAASSGLPELLLVGPDGWGSTQQQMPGVHIRGYQSQEELPAVVAGARALVMPSRYEGFGLPVLEALAAGTEVIISDTPALVEVAGAHGRVFPVGDPTALAQLLLDTAADTDDARAARLVRQSYAAGWTWDGCADATLAAYRAAAG